MQQTVEKVRYAAMRRKNGAAQAAVILRMLAVWRNRAGRKLSDWDEVKTIRQWRDKRR